jgi:hypothetical protein
VNYVIKSIVKKKSRKFTIHHNRLKRYHGNFDIPPEIDRLISNESLAELNTSGRQMTRQRGDNGRSQTPTSVVNQNNVSNISQPNSADGNRHSSNPGSVNQNSGYQLDVASPFQPTPLYSTPVTTRPRNRHRSSSLLTSDNSFLENVTNNESAGNNETELSEEQRVTATETVLASSGNASVTHDNESSPNVANTTNTSNNDISFAPNQYYARQLRAQMNQQETTVRRSTRNRKQTSFYGRE